MHTDTARTIRHRNEKYHGLRSAGSRHLATAHRVIIDFFWSQASQRYGQPTGNRRRNAAFLRHAVLHLPASPMDTQVLQLAGGCQTRRLLEIDTYIRLKVAVQLLRDRVQH